MPCYYNKAALKQRYDKHYDKAETQKILKLILTSHNWCVSIVKLCDRQMIYLSYSIKKIS